MHSLRERRRHGVGHQGRRVLLLWSLCLGEGERRVGDTILCTTLARAKLLGRIVVLAPKGSRLVVTKIGLSITIVAASASAKAIGAVVIAPITSILGICAKSFIWSIIKASTIIPIPVTAKISPSRIPIPAVIVTTSASP